MNFLSVINEITNPESGLEYNNQTKELTFTNPETQETVKCYVNSMQALVNFFREYALKYFDSEKNDNINAAFYIQSCSTDPLLNSVDYIQFPTDNEGNPIASSYVQWLKIAIECINIANTLKNTKGEWIAGYSLSGLPEGKQYGPSFILSFDGIIDWGDGTSSNFTAGKQIYHKYTANGEYTIIAKYGTGVEELMYEREDGDTQEAQSVYTPFKFKKTPTA